MLEGPVPPVEVSNDPVIELTLLDAAEATQVPEGATAQVAGAVDESSRT